MSTPEASVLEAALADLLSRDPTIERTREGLRIGGVIFPIPRNGDAVMRALYGVAQTVKAEVAS